MILMHILLYVRVDPLAFHPSNLHQNAVFGAVLLHLVVHIILQFVVRLPHLFGLVNRPLVRSLEVVGSYKRFR